MTWWILVYILMGLAAGILSGLIGVGGGIILIPAFVYILGLTQQQAQGTTLALFIPPIGILAAYVYYKEGHVNLTIASFVCLGFFFGGLIGAKLANSMSNEVLQRVFGGVLLLVALRMLFSK